MGSDPETKVVILTGTGDTYSGPRAAGGTGMRSTPAAWDRVYWEGKHLLMSLLDIEVPMISAINGPAWRHSEIPLLCDIVLAADDVQFQDSAHFPNGMVPGDGMHIVYPLLLGWNRGRYFLLTGQTLDATALIHEAYLRLADQAEVRWQNRAHFFGVAAKAMRHIVVDHVRTRRAAKRGGAARKVPLDTVSLAVERPVDVVALDDALQALAALDRRKSQVVELKYFGGLTVREIAEVLHVSEETVARDWRLARTWLLRELSRSARSD